PSGAGNRLRWRISNGSTRRTSNRPGPCVMVETVSRVMGASSEQEVTLRQRQHGGRLAGEQLAVGAHLVGLRVDLDMRLVVVVDQVALADRTCAAHGAQRLAEAEPATDVRFEGGLRDEGQRGGLQCAAVAAEHRTE